MKKIVAISGSLRKDSYNTQLLNKIKNLLPSNIEYEIIDISGIPLFNEDVESISLPDIVVQLKNKIMVSDLVIISTPEYNYSISGVLKNSLDWFSRGEVQPFSDKTTVIISASMSRFGGVRAQAHLRQVLLRLDAKVLNKPEIFISNAVETINDKRTIIELQKLVKVILENI